MRADRLSLLLIEYKPYREMTPFPLTGLATGNIPLTLFVKSNQLTELTNLITYQSPKFVR